MTSLSNSIPLSNMTFNGSGGVISVTLSSTTYKLTLSSLSFTSCSASSYGGAAYIDASSYLSISTLSFSSLSFTSCTSDITKGGDGVYIKTSSPLSTLTGLVDVWKDLLSISATSTYASTRDGVYIGRYSSSSTIDLQISASHPMKGNKR